MTHRGLVPFLAFLSMVTPAKADCVAEFFAMPTTSRLSAPDAARAMLRDPDYKRCINQSTEAVKPPKTTLAKLKVRPAKSTAVWKPLPPPPEWRQDVFFMLRRDFNDIWLFDRRENVLDLTDVPDAEGAEFSVSGDRLTHNTTWNAHAMASVVYQLVHDRYPAKDDPWGANFIGLSVAPFVKIDRVTNSIVSAKLNNVDEVSFGGALEVGFDFLGTSQYFRARGAGTSDRISGETSGSGVFEWTPVIDGVLNSPLPLNLPVTIVFGPQLRARYDNVIVNDVSGAKDFLFRVGPAATLQYKLDRTLLPQTLTVLDILAKLHGQTSVSWLESVKTGATYSYVNTSLTYNVDDAGHVGISGSYTNGRTEDTGRRVDLWRAGLTLKW